MSRVNILVFKKFLDLKYQRIFLIVFSCLLVLSFSLPVYGQTIRNQQTFNTEDNDADSIINSFWNKINSNLPDYKTKAKSTDLSILGQYHTNMRTFLPWKSLEDNTLRVSIIEMTKISEEQLSNIKNAIVGYGTVKFDDSQAFVSWNEALQETLDFKSITLLPTNIIILPENNEDADITIYVSDEQNPVYSGYAANVIEDQRIVKSNIIIYDINNLIGKEISSIVRHEFGHALGLRHCDLAGDLMFGIVPVPSYVSEHHVATLLSLYQSTPNHLSIDAKT